MRFSKVVFLIAGIWGIIVLLPGYFTEQRFAAQFPPPVTHPEFYYGFYGVALAWQVAFLIIAGDPARFRGIIPAGVLEKLSFAGATAALFAAGRLGPLFAAFGLIDLTFGILFIICYVRLSKPVGQAAARRSEGDIILPTLIPAPTRIRAAGNLPKLIDEYVGRVNNREAHLSIAHMRSPAGWQEPGQAPEFTEYTLVLRGRLRVRSREGEFDVTAGQAVIAHPGEWVQYSTPDEATEYVAICVPAFSLDTVHRDSSS